MSKYSALQIFIISTLTPAVSAQKPDIMSGVWSTDSGECYAEVYEHGSYGGWKAKFPVGNYPFSKFVKKGAKNDDASSLKVVGANCQVEVYQHGDYSGWKAVFTTGSYPFSKFVKGGAKNDDASSIKVVKKEAPVCDPTEHVVHAMKQHDKAIMKGEYLGKVAAAKKTLQKLQSFERNIPRYNKFITSGTSNYRQACYNDYKAKVKGLSKAIQSIMKGIAGVSKALDDVTHYADNDVLKGSQDEVSKQGLKIKAMDLEATKNFKLMAQADALRESAQKDGETYDEVSSKLRKIASDYDKSEITLARIVAACDKKKMSLLEVNEEVVAESSACKEAKKLQEESECTAEVYQHGDYKGWKAVYPVGNYPFGKFVGKGAKNDDASSLKVVGSCEVQVFQHGDYGGWKATYKTGNYPFSKFVKGGSKNDDASSLKVLPGVGTLKRDIPDLKSDVDGLGKRKKCGALPDVMVAKTNTLVDKAEKFIEKVDKIKKKVDSKL